MIKKNKLKLIISSIIILLPMLFGFFAGTLLPEDIAIHWGADGNPDGFMNSTLIFIILPLIMLAVHWICMISTAIVDKKNEQNRKAMGIVFWIIPLISLFANGFIFATALGYNVDVHTFVFILLGIVFIAVGNYLPKTTRNISLGIKIKWTLANDDNWNATHRFGGKVFVIMGLLCLVAVFLPVFTVAFVLLAIVAICVLLPVIYSYGYYKKQLKEGKATKEDYNEGINDVVKSKKHFVISSVIITVVAVLFIAVLMFSGSIDTTLGDSSLTVKSSFSSDIVLNYADIESVEYREHVDVGIKEFGFDSAKMCTGNFKNEEFGNYTRYTYRGDIPCLVLKSKGRTYVIGAENAQAVKQMYDTLSAKIAK